MHLRQHSTDARAMRGCWCGGIRARELAHQGGWFARQWAKQCAICAGVRSWHRQVFTRQMLHELKIKRQLLCGQHLKNGQHIIGALAVSIECDKKIRILNATGNAFKLDQAAKV